MAKRWDPIVKLTHWGIVAAVIGNALITEEGSGWHIWVGYGLAALLALRLLWGLVGPREARFGSFPPSLARASHHVAEIRRGEVTHHASHNPLGALMVYAIWGTLLVVVGTGIAMSGPPPANPSQVRGEHGERGEGGRGESEQEEKEEAGERADKLVAVPAAMPAPVKAEAGEPRREASEREEAEEEVGEASERREERAEAPRAAASGSADAALAVAPTPAAPAIHPQAGEQKESEEGGEGEEEGPLGELHELAVNLLYVLIALHLMGVVFETRRSGPQIVRAMLPGGNRD